MDALLLARLQFAISCMFHFLFVPLTLGLVWIVATLETRHVLKGDSDAGRLSGFWGKIFAINFAFGVVTGISLEFQIGANWSRYSAYVGDVFGSLLAIEATTAFFFESIFLAVWVFARHRLSAKMRLASIWIVVAATNASGFWILCANAWMRNPVGYVIRNGRAELTDFFAVVTQPTALLAFMHTVIGACALAGFVVMAVSAYHLLKKNDTALFQKSFRLGMWFALIFSIAEGGTGHFSAVEVAETQPVKMAAMESLWETGTHVPIYLLLIPDEKNEKNAVELLRVTPALSLLVGGRPETEVQGLKDFAKEDRPPVTLVYFAFRAMVGIGLLMIFLSLLAWYKRDRLIESPRFLKLMLFAFPLPYIAVQAGWIVTEMGRQPWLVHGLMRVSEGSSRLPAWQIGFTLICFFALYSLLGLANLTILLRIAKRGALSDKEGESHA